MKKASLIYWAAISAFVALASCEKPKSAVQTGPPEVLVTEVVQKEVPEIRQWVGTLNGFENADVKTRTTGYLLRRAYQQGGYVKTGDLLFEIDPRPFQATLAQAKGQLQEAKATMLGVELDAKRAKELFEGKVISPLDGIAGLAQAQIGDLVGTGSNTTLTTVSQIEPILCYFPISEQTYWEFADLLKEIMAVAEDKRPEKVELILPDGSVYRHKGKFDFVDRQVDPKTGTIQIAVSFPNPELTLRPGQYATARAEIGRIPNALVIPQEAVSELQGGNQVGVVGADGKAEIRAVKLGPLYGHS